MNHIQNNLSKYNLSNITCPKCNDSINVIADKARRAPTFANFINCNCTRFRTTRYYDALSIRTNLEVNGNCYVITIFLYENGEVESIIQSLVESIANVFDATVYDEVYRSNNIIFSDLSNQTITALELETILTFM